MSITITDEVMTCSHSPHWAWCAHGGWVVTWLDEPVEHNTAITALTLAELHSDRPDYQQLSPADRHSLVAVFAAELDMTSETAAARIQHSTQQAQNLHAAASRHSSDNNGPVGER